MRLKRAWRRGVLALTVTVGIAGAAGVSVVLSEPVGATIPKPRAAWSQSADLVAMALPTSPLTMGSATRLLAMQQMQLAAPQLPGYFAENWAPFGTQRIRTIDGHEIGENECAKVDGAGIWTQQSFSGGGGQNVAIQDTFAFTSSGTAQSAYQNVVAGMSACQQITRALQASNNVSVDATVTNTVSQAGAAAWARSWTGVMGVSAAGPQTNHLYVALAGTSLIVLQFTEFPGHAAVYDVTADPSVLSIIEAGLAR